MTVIRKAFVGLVLAVLLFSVVATASAGPVKVKVCCFRGGGPGSANASGRVRLVPEKNVDKHLAHGDYAENSTFSCAYETSWTPSLGERGDICYWPPLGCVLD
jgi:hypothetical protein